MVYCPELVGHDLEGLLPGNRFELALLVELALAVHAQERARQAVLAVHDLGQEVALDAVEAAVHRRERVALDGHDAVVLGGHHDAAAGAAEAADGLVPAPVALGGLGVLLGHGRSTLRPSLVPLLFFAIPLPPLVSNVSS